MKKKMTRFERFEARMQKLDADLHASTQEAALLIADHKAAKKAEAAKKVAKVIPEWSTEQQAAIDALTTIQGQCEALVQPIADLIGLAIKDLSSYEDLSRYEAAVATVTDTKKDRLKTAFPFKPMSLVKLTGNPNDHNYPNKPVLVMHDDFGVVWDAKVGAWVFGNHLPHDLGCYKTVTPKEISAAADNLYILPNGFPDILLED